MFGLQLPPGIEGLQLPPRLPTPRSRWNSFRPHVGEEIAFKDLIPGEHYFRRFTLGPYANAFDNYEEIVLEAKGTNNEGELDNTYSFYSMPQMRYLVNQRGDPELPYEVPQAPGIPGLAPPSEVLQFDIYHPNTWRFYKVAAVRRGRHLVGQQIKNKHNKNTRRRYINNILEKKGFSTDLGTGPANLIREFANLQPPKGAVTTYTVPSGMIKYRGTLKQRRAKTRRTKNRY